MAMMILKMIEDTTILKTVLMRTKKLPVMITAVTMITMEATTVITIPTITKVINNDNDTDKEHDRNDSGSYRRIKTCEARVAIITAMIMVVVIITTTPPRSGNARG